MLHAAQVLRQYADGGDEDILMSLQISTACAPVVKRYDLPMPHHVLSPADMPTVAHGGFVIVEWRVRENPTCLACIIASEAFK